MIEDGVGIVALVGEHRLRAAIAEQCDGLGAVVGLAARQHEAQRQPQRVGEQVDLGRQTSSTPPQSALRTLFFAPPQPVDGRERRWNRSSRSGCLGPSRDPRRPDPRRRSPPSG